jgi:hypothetical protein
MPAATMQPLKLIDQLLERLLDQYVDLIQQTMRDELDENSNQIKLQLMTGSISTLLQTLVAGTEPVTR